MFCSPWLHNKFQLWFLSKLGYICTLFIWFDTQQAQKVIENHDPSKPLFLYLPFQNVHFPVQAPQRYIDKYSFINNKIRRTYAAMLDIVDEAIGNVTNSLQKAG